MDSTDALDALDRIIWSADVPDVPAVERWLDQMPQLRLIKIDRLFVDSNDWGVFPMLHERGLLVFDDAKMVEISSKLGGDPRKDVPGLVHTHLRRARPWMLNCMAGSVANGNYDLEDDELDALKRFADACNKAGTLSCAVTVLTSKSEEMVPKEFGGRTSIEQVLWYAQQLVLAGFTDMVCSPMEVASIRAESYFDKLSLNTPSIRPAGSAANDQQRIGTPAGTLSAGANRLVIGRPLTEGAGTPSENLEAIVAEVQTV